MKKSFEAGPFIDGLWRVRAAIPFGMDWRGFLITLIRGVLKFVADEYYPIGGRRKRAEQDAPQQPNKEAPPEAPHTAGWGPPSEAPAVTVILQTDAGATVSTASFIGDECFGVPKVERTRRPGESRRTRRKTTTPNVADAPQPNVATNTPQPTVTAAPRPHTHSSLPLQRMRQRLAERAANIPTPPAPAPKTRPRATRGLSITTDTLMLLRLGAA